MNIFIVNPVAGNGRAKRLYKNLIKMESVRHISFLTFYTEYEGHAEEIMQQLLNKYNPADIHAVIVFGGDGTIHEVINGIGNCTIPVSFIPGGSGNDFARGVSLQKSPTEIMYNIISNDKDTTYSLGEYHVENREKTRKFVNCIGFGFDAVVAKTANESKLKKILNTFKLGKISYLFALITQLFFYKPITITVETDGVRKTFHHCFLMTINNQPYFGGGMKINPLAKNNAEHFSILVIDSISKWKVLFLFGTVFTGKHIHFKEVHTFNARTLKVKAKEKVPFQVDGETGMTYTCVVKKHDNPIKVLGAS